MFIVTIALSLASLPHYSGVFFYPLHFFFPNIYINKFCVIYQLIWETDLMLISRLPNPNILQQSEPNGLKLWIITVNWGIKMLDFCQILKWPVSKSYWKLVLFFENNDIFSFILYHHASNAGVDLWRCVDTQISTAVVTHCHINRDLKCWE